MADIDTALGQQIFGLSQRQRVASRQPVSVRLHETRRQGPDGGQGDPRVGSPTTARDISETVSGSIALGLGKCELKNLASDMTAEGIAPVDGSALILDEQFGGAICVPCRGKRDGQNVSGMQCEVYRNADDAEVMNSWTTLE